MMIETESHLKTCPVQQPQPAAADAPEADRCPVPTGWRKWIARFGLAGFIFFFVKGLAWLIVPALLAWMAAR